MRSLNTSKLKIWGNKTHSWAESQILIEKVVLSDGSAENAKNRNLQQLVVYI